MRVIKLVINKIKVHSPKTKLSLIKVTKQASIANQESISCKCASLYNTKRYKYFKEGRKCFIYYYELVD